MDLSLLVRECADLVGRSSSISVSCSLCNISLRWISCPIYWPKVLVIWGLLGEFDGLVAILFLCIRGIHEGHLCGIRIILCLVLRPSLHGHYLSVRLQLLLSLSGFVGMMIATDVYFLQFHSCVVYLRVLCVELCQRLLRNLVVVKVGQYFVVFQMYNTRSTYQHFRTEILLKNIIMFHEFYWSIQTPMIAIGTFYWKQILQPWATTVKLELPTRAFHKTKWWPQVLKEEFEDTKGVIRIHKWSRTDNTMAKRKRNVRNNFTDTNEAEWGCWKISSKGKWFLPDHKLNSFFQ